jgi:hypothetical protein
VIERAGLARHPLVVAGVLVATVAAVVFGVLVIATVAGMFPNPYAGLVVFVAIPGLFVVGLLLIAAGVLLQRRRLLRDPSAAEWPVLDFRQAGVRRAALLYTILTAGSVMVVLLAGYGSLHWMESPSFCGQVCHTPMQPQFTAWSAGPHARVACAQCHIGEGAKGFVQAKLAGVRQLVHVVTGGYPRPIPPGVEMPPGAQAQTCANCHRAWRAEGDRIRVLREYADDETSTETVTVLHMHVGAGSASGRAIHWHANPANRVEYVSTDPARETIPYVRVTGANGHVKEYRSADATDQAIAAGARRVMDCMDCHNTVGHPMAPTPEKAVDAAIAASRVSRSLPFARRESVALVKTAYASPDAAEAGIDRGVRTFYASRAGVDPGALTRTVAALKDVYRGNVFPTMKIAWGAYPTQKGHVTATGCFRCHDDSHKASDGSTISADCEYCHKQIEPGS